MKRYLKAFSLIAGLGLLLSAAAEPSRTAEAAHGLFKSVSAAAGALRPAAQATAALRHSTLSRPRVSRLENGRLVVALESSGDVRGDLTLILDTDQDGTVSAGTWSLVSSYVEDVGGAHHDDEPGGEAEGGHGEKFVDDGTLSGNVLSGSVSLDTDGSVVAVSAVQLEVKGGSLTFAGVTQGDGLVSGSNLADKDAASGSLALNF